MESGILWVIALYVGCANNTYTFINKLTPSTLTTQHTESFDTNPPPQHESIEQLELSVGDAFKIKAADYNPGRIQYVGYIEGAYKEAIGVSLNLWPSDGTDGTFNGVSYFHSPQKKGLFLYPSNHNEQSNAIMLMGGKLNATRIIKENVKYCSLFQLEQGIIDIEVSSPITNESQYLFEVNANHENSLRVHNLRINDRVQLFRGVQGTVRYVGDVSWTHGEMIAIELDEKVGAHEWNRRYFRRTEIKEVLGRNDAMNGKAFMLEIDIKNAMVNVMSVDNAEKKWSMDIDIEMHDMRVIFYLRGAASVQLKEQWWQQY